eukprot:5023197-Prymnesium_polylepis.1
MAALGRNGRCDQYRLARLARSTCYRLRLRLRLGLGRASLLLTVRFLLPRPPCLLALVLDVRY